MCHNTTVLVSYCILSESPFCIPVSRMQYSRAIMYPLCKQLYPFSMYPCFSVSYDHIYMICILVSPMICIPISPMICIHVSPIICIPISPMICIPISPMICIPFISYEMYTCITYDMYSCIPVFCIPVSLYHLSQYPSCLLYHYTKIMNFISVETP